MYRLSDAKLQQIRRLGVATPDVIDLLTEHVALRKIAQAAELYVHQPETAHFDTLCALVAKWSETPA